MHSRASKSAIHLQSETQLHRLQSFKSRALLTFQLRNQTQDERRRNKETPYFAAGTFGLLHPSFSFDDIHPRRVDPTFIDFSIIKEWLQLCRSHHANTCDSTTGDRVKGLKLIDCKTKAVLVADTTSRYVALSYVWGAVQMTEKERGVLPATIEDSMLVTLKLGHRYLWVDKYVS
jgi:hypothetical protein